MRDVKFYLHRVREILSVDLSFFVDCAQSCSSSSNRLRLGVLHSGKFISIELVVFYSESSLGGNKGGDKLKIILSEDEVSEVGLITRTKKTDHMLVVISTD